MNTTYWIGVQTNQTGSARNWSTFNNLFDFATSYADTATFNGTAWTTAGGSSTNAMGMEILGTVAVPEPSTCVMALAGLACGGYSLFRRRRAR